MVELGAARRGRSSVMAVGSEVEGSAQRATTPLAVYTEGITAGLAGGAAIAAWFFILDCIQGRPLYTPTVLGAAVFRSTETLKDVANIQPSIELALAFTWFHVLVFMLLGLAASRLVWLAERVPAIGFGILMFFVIFEVGFMIVCLSLAEPVIPALSWPAILIGNLLAAFALGGVLWRRHPGLAIEP
jgi:hypothetical protein